MRRLFNENLQVVDIGIEARGIFESCALYRKGVNRQIMSVPIEDGKEGKSLQVLIGQDLR
jgi:hypothetical protein